MTRDITTTTTTTTTTIIIIIITIIDTFRLANTNFIGSISFALYSIM
jgi:hypothetical protein